MLYEVITVVAFVIYQLISIIRGTRSVQMVLGLGILFVVYFVRITSYNVCYTKLLRHIGVKGK